MVFRRIYTPYNDPLTSIKGKAMNKFQMKLASVKKFVTDHKTAIAVVGATTATAAVGVVALKKQADGWNEFLTEKNLFDEFYNSED